jgi:type IV pilus assembly protein PilX
MTPNKSSQGFILIVALLLLLTLTLLALAGISINSSQTRVAANATDSEISFEKVEATLNRATNLLMNYTYTSANFLQNQAGLYQWSPTTAPVWQTVNWSGGSVIPGFSNANFIIEQLPSVIKPGQNMSASTSVYRITAQVTGQNGSSYVLLQSTVQMQ